MKLTKETLKRIIKEELDGLLNEYNRTSVQGAGGSSDEGIPDRRLDPKTAEYLKKAGINPTTMTGYSQPSPPEETKPYKSKADDMMRRDQYLYTYKVMERLPNFIRDNVADVARASGATEEEVLKKVDELDKMVSNKESEKFFAAIPALKQSMGETLFNKAMKDRSFLQKAGRFFTKGSFSEE